MRNDAEESQRVYETPTLEAMTPVTKDEGASATAISQVFDEASKGCNHHPWREDIGSGAFVLHSVLSHTECVALRNQLSKSNESFWKEGHEHADARRFRDALTCEVTCDHIAHVLFQRIKTLIEPTVDIAPSSPVYEAGLDGTWYADGVNAKLLFGRYPPGGQYVLALPHSA